MDVKDKKSRPGTLEQVFSDLRKSALMLRKERFEDRIHRLQSLRNWIHRNRKAIQDAAFADFSKNPTEVDGIEIFHVLNEIRHAQKSLDVWSKPRKVDAPITMLGTRSYIQAEPRGVCLIIAPWNYPFSLAVGPLVSALAAGNAVIMKPSELTPNMASLLKNMADEIFDPAIVTVFEGGPEVSQSLLQLPFDHIFFTGSPSIGKVIMRAAAENLTSVTLELGGKSPAVVTSSARIEEAAKRIAVAKFVNNGQTCVAPDYVLVDETVAARFTAALITQTKKFFLEDGQDFETSPSYCRIVNQSHFNRLNDLLKDAVDHGAALEFGGKVDREQRFIHPMILTGVSGDSRVMNEEIFGPILPVTTYKKLDQAIEIINAKPKPLALYVFASRKDEHQQVLRETSSGGACVNECAIHFLHHGLPFGGVNHSGIGKSHGYQGFLAFSNEKPVMKQRKGWTPIQLFYPPYTNWSAKMLDWFLKLF